MFDILSHARFHGFIENKTCYTSIALSRLIFHVDLRNRFSDLTRKLVRLLKVLGQKT